MADAKEKNDFLEYKGKPLVRNGNTIYYGNMNEDFVVVIQITSTKEVKDLEVSDRVIVQLVSTDPNIRPKERIIKKAEKRGLYNAMDIGSIWLERELEKRS